MPAHLETKPIQGVDFVLVAVAILLLSSLSTSLYHIVIIGLDKLPQQTFRFTIECLIGWHLYRGKSWARWLTIIFSIGGLLICIPMVLGHGPFNVLGLLLIAYTCVLGLLLFGPGVREHFTPRNHY